MTVELTPRRHLVVAIGDSFASGEGNPDYPAEFRRFSRQPPNDWATEPNYPVHSLDVVSARWLDPDCHRSLLSWPALYALRKALTQPNTVVQFASLACSGAEVLDGFLLPQRSPPRGRLHRQQEDGRCRRLRRGCAHQPDHGFLVVAQLHRHGTHPACVINPTSLRWSAVRRTACARTLPGRPTATR